MGKKFTDRKDGMRLKEIDGFHYIMPYLMPNRSEAEVYIEEEIDVTELVTYLKKRNDYETQYKTTIFHVFATAIAKTIYHRPRLNYFVAGKRLYRRNKMTLAFVARREFADNAEESLIITEVNGDTTLDEMSRKIVGDVQHVRKKSGNDINGLLDKLKKAPRWLMRLGMCFFRFLDFHGWMPESICKGDSNYATVLLSNLGSIQCDAAYHHLNDYGTNSIVITIGKIHKSPVVDDDGNIQIRDVVNIGATADERIADGFYFARSIKMLGEILQDPEQLELPIRNELAQ